MRVSPLAFADSVTEGANKRRQEPIRPAVRILLAAECTLRADLIALDFTLSKFVTTSTRRRRAHTAESVLKRGFGKTNPRFSDAAVKPICSFGRLRLYLHLPRTVSAAGMKRSPVQRSSHIPDTLDVAE